MLRLGSLAKRVGPRSCSLNAGIGLPPCVKRECGLRQQAPPSAPGVAMLLRAGFSTRLRPEADFQISGYLSFNVGVRSYIPYFLSFRISFNL